MRCFIDENRNASRTKFRERKVDIQTFLGRRARSLPGWGETAFSSSYRRPLWNFSRRTLLPRLRRAPRLGICRSTTVDRARRLGRETSFWRLAYWFAFLPSARGRRNRLAYRQISSRNGRRRLRASSGRARSDLRADLSRDASLADDERVRAIGLDGLRLVHRPRD